MSYTILSARFSNSEGTCVEIQTTEAGAVLISEADRPELWKQLIDSGMRIEEMATPDPVPDPSAPVVVRNGS